VRTGTRVDYRRVVQERSPSALAEVLRASLRLGLTSFGGPIAHIAWFRREYVERRRWLDEARFADLVALCQLLPGPASSQLGIAIGTGRAGLAGGLVSWLGFTLPSAVLLVTFALLAGSIDITGAGWIHGLKLAAVAVVAHAVLLMWRALAPDGPRRVIVVVATGAALAWSSPIAQVAIIAGGALVGRIAVRAAPGGAVREAQVVGRRTAVVAIGAFVLLLVGLPAMRAALPAQEVALAETFYRAGSLVFGGGHVVLPLLHESVVPAGWVSEDLFLAGYGAAQAVPGPLFTFAGFLGAAMDPQPNGVAGAALALVFIFLPSFLLVWGILPIWDRLRGWTGARQALAGTNAAVVGILAAALYTPIWTSAVERPLDAVAAAAGFGLLALGKAPPWLVVALAAGAGEVLVRI
jgi:chromate transporter